MLPVTRHLGLGVRATAGNRSLWLAETGLRLVGMLLRMTPAVVAVLLVFHHVAATLANLPRTFHPVALLALDLVAYVTSFRFLAPVLGLVASGALIVGALRVLYLSGAYGRLAAHVRTAEPAPHGTFMDTVARRFAPAVGVAVVSVLATAAFVGWTVVVVWSAATLAAGGGAGGAAALALALTLVVLGAVGLTAAREVAYVRAVALDEPALVAAYEGARFVLRRPGRLLGLGLLLLALSIGVAIAVGLATGTQSMLPATAAASGLATAARITGVVIETVAFAGVAVVAQGALVALVLDDAGRLPKPPAPPAPKVYPASPVRRAEPVFAARPVPPSEATSPEGAPPSESPPEDAPSADAPDDDEGGSA